MLRRWQSVSEPTPKHRVADPEVTRLATLHAALRHAMLSRKGIHPSLDYPAGLAYH